MKKKKVKQQYIQNLKEKIEKAKSIAVIDYQTLDSRTLEEIRKAISQAGGQLMVVKNTLFKHALGDKYNIEKTASISGPTAAVFAFEDEIEPLQTLGKIDDLKIKFGIFEKKILTDTETARIVRLPTKEVLFGQTIANIASPIYGLVFVLNANMQNLISILGQKAKSE